MNLESDDCFPGHVSFYRRPPRDPPWEPPWRPPPPDLGNENSNLPRKCPGKCPLNPKLLNPNLLKPNLCKPNLSNRLRAENPSNPNGKPLVTIPTPYGYAHGYSSTWLTRI